MGNDAYQFDFVDENPRFLAEKVTTTLDNLTTSNRRTHKSQFAKIRKIEIDYETLFEIVEDLSDKYAQQRHEIVTITARANSILGKIEEIVEKKDTQIAKLKEMLRQRDREIAELREASGESTLKLV